MMRVLYCVTDPALLMGENNEFLTSLLAGLAHGDHELRVLVLGDEESSRLMDIGQPDVRVDFHVANTHDTADFTLRQFAAAIATLAAQDEYAVIIGHGLLLNQMLVNHEETAMKLWSVLSAAEIDEEIEAGKAGHSSVQGVVTRNQLTMVEDILHKRSVQRVAPSVHHRIVDASGFDFQKGLRMRASAKRVLLYRSPDGKDLSEWTSETFQMVSSLASSDVHVILLCHDGHSLFASTKLSTNPHVTLLEPPSSSHQVKDGCLQSRYAAWHLAVASKNLDCCVVMTDDLAAVVHGYTNVELRGRLWPIIRFDDLAGFNSSRQLFERLSEWARRLVFVDDAARAVFESRISSATSKTVLLPLLLGTDINEFADDLRDADKGRLFAKHLQRSVADYKSFPLCTVARRILVAGHDFKFAGELLDVLSQREDVELRADHWSAQNTQDEDLSRSLLDWADVIFCEFASYNAVWYSWEKKPNQNLIVRFHGYELFSPWIQDINLANVDQIVFVSEFYRDKVVKELGWPLEKTTVIPNVVDLLDLSRSKRSGARFHLGIVGIVPILKRPDRALDLLELLLETDLRYTLHVRGRAPWHYGWMWQNEDIRDAYEAFYERLASNPHLRRRVSFEEFGPDMGRWFQNIGWMLSPSFRETFHLAPVEGMASGAVPVVWDREGANEIFGDDWVHGSTRSAADYIISANKDAAHFDEQSKAAVEHARQFDVTANGRKWLRLLLSANSCTHSSTPSKNISAERFEARFIEAPTAGSLARLMSVLVRDGNQERVHDLALANPEFIAELPPHFLFESNWAEGIDELTRNPLSIPPRSIGAAYLVRRGSVMYATDSSRIQGNADWLAELSNSAGNSESIRLVTVPSAALDPHFVNNAPDRAEIDVEGVCTVRLPVRNSEGLLVSRYVIAAADALVREARAFRPAAIAAQADFWIALPALLAARRLGIPFLVESWQDSTGRGNRFLSDRCRSESDAIFELGSSPVQSLRLSIQNFENAIDQIEQRDLSSLKIGVIADQFTSHTISHSFETVPLSRADGYSQVASLALDAIFIESAWEGPQNEWRRGVAYYPDEIADLERIIKVANARNIPVIFWNKEDPVHFRAFARTASMVDHVFTTDADMIGKYLRSPDSVVKSVSSLPFYAEPAIHNPLPTDRLYRHTVSYAGTYYGDRFRERSIELNRILAAAKIHGLTIYDRQVNVPNSPYSFPATLAEFVSEGVPYEEVLKVYKAHPVNINVNSANDSPTMFSRRVVEIAASGSVVLSGKGRGITEQIQGIEASDSDERWAELLEIWMTNESNRIDEAWRQMRTITRSHLAEQALTIVMRTAGLAVVARQLPTYAIVSTTLTSRESEAILRQTWAPLAVYTDHMDERDSLRLRSNGITVAPIAEQQNSEAEWLAGWTNVPTDTYFEDLLHATRFGDWDVLGGKYHESDRGVGRPIVELSRSGTFAEARRKDMAIDSEGEAPLTWIIGALQE